MTPNRPWTLNSDKYSAGTKDEYLYLPSNNNKYSAGTKYLTPRLILFSPSLQSVHA